jgi:hypothetical protein
MVMGRLAGQELLTGPARNKFMRKPQLSGRLNKIGIRMAGENAEIIREEGLFMGGKRNLIRFRLLFDLSFGGIFIFAFVLPLIFLITFWHPF